MNYDKLIMMNYDKLTVRTDMYTSCMIWAYNI